MSQQIFRTRYRIELGHPHRAHGVARLALGAFLLIAGAVVLSSLGSSITSTVARLDELTRFEPSWAAAVLLSLAFSVVFGVVAVAMGISSIVIGIRDTRRIHLPQKVPADLRNTDELMGSLENRELTSTAVQDGLATGLLRMLRGDGINYIPPTMRFIAISNAGSLLRSLVPVALLIALAVGSRAAADATGLGGLVIPAPIALVTIVLVAGIARLAAAALLVPDDAPDADFARSVQELGSAGHPESLLAQLEMTSDGFRYEDIPNRVYMRDDVSLSGEGVSDTGRVQGGMLFETQPVPSEDPPKAGGYVLLTVGALLTAAGVLMLANVPGRGLSAGPPSLPGVALHIVTGIVAFRHGVTMLGQARRILARFRFTSDLFLVRFGGTYYRSEVGAGTAVSDTLQSKSLAVRTELVVRSFCTTATTESVEFGARYVIAANVDGRLQERLSLLDEALSRFQGAGVKLTGVDLEGGEAAAQLTKANLQMVGARAKAASEGWEGRRLGGTAERPMIARDGPGGWAPGEADGEPVPPNDAGEADDAEETPGLTGAPLQRDEPAAGSSHRGTAPDDYIVEITRLGELVERGLLTEEEFATRKRKLLEKLDD